MQAYLNTAIKAARKAGDIAQINFDRIESKDVRTKSYNEFATHVDEQAERAIIEIIRSRYPEHSILGEEHGMQDNDSEFIWIIDPIDGTTNYIHGFPVYCVSIALKIKDRLEVGVIYDPSRQELFTAIRGMGSQLDGRKIRVSKQGKLQGCLLGTGFPYRNDEECLKVYLEMFSDFAKVIQSPKNFLIGLVSQLIFLPLIALIIVFIWPLQPELAIGLILIAAAPGGVTSNILTSFI